MIAITWFVTAKHDLLPAIYLNRTSLSPIANFAALAVFLACVVALALLWYRGSSVLDLWLIVTVYAWALEITLQGLWTFSHRLLQPCLVCRPHLLADCRQRGADRAAVGYCDCA